MSPSRPGCVLCFRPSGPLVEPCSTQADCNCQPERRSRRVWGAGGVAAKTEQAVKSETRAAKRRTLRSTADWGRDMEVPRNAWYMRAAERQPQRHEANGTGGSMEAFRSEERRVGKECRSRW